MRSHVQLCDPLDCSSPASTVHRIFQARILEWIAISTSKDLPDPGIEPASAASPALQACSLPAEPLGNTYFYLILTEKLWNCLMNIVRSQS